MPKLSIIIPTLNEEKYLPNLLYSIKKQSFDDYEIIIADNNSKDKTISIAKKFRCKIVKGGFPSKARNSGAKYAKGYYLLFLDADVILPENFLQQIIHEFEKNKLDIATTKIIPLSNKEIDKVLHELSNIFIKTLQYIKPFCGGFCILTKNEMHKKINGFDENLNNLCDDHDYAQRMAKIGKFRILNEPKLFISTRRLEKEGRAKLISKYSKSTFYNLIGKKYKNNNIEYEWGNYGN